MTEKCIDFFKLHVLKILYIMYIFKEISSNTGVLNIFSLKIKCRIITQELKTQVADSRVTDVC